MISTSSPFQDNHFPTTINPLNVDINNYPSATHYPEYTLHSSNMYN